MKLIAKNIKQAAFEKQKLHMSNDIYMSKCLLKCLLWMPE